MTFSYDFGPSSCSLPLVALWVRVGRILPSAFTSFPTQEKGLRLEAASCFRLLLPLATLNSMQQCWPRLGGPQLCVRSYSIRWLIIPSWVALRNSGWIHHHVHLFGPKRGSLGQGAIVAVFIVVPYPFSWSHLMESKSKRWGHPRTGEQRVPTQMRRVRRKSEGGSPKGLALEPDTCAPHQEICKMEM